MKTGKIDKRKCRKYAGMELRISPNSGLLYAEQIGCIVRTAVRNIDHHKVLVLYVYSREAAAKGDCRPKWTVFQNREDFATLERREEGILTWRKAAFEDLDRKWAFVSRCAFFSPKDEERIGRFFRERELKGFVPLLRAQHGIQRQRGMERQRRREQKVIARMDGLPPLPRGLNSWLHGSIMPAYFFYDYHRGRKAVKGICSSCGKEVEVIGARYNAKGACPNCGREVTMKSRGRRGSLHDRETCQVLQKTGDREVAVRILKVYYDYQMGDMPQKSIHENARIFVRCSREGKLECESYYYAYGGGKLTNWKKGSRPIINRWQYNFEADQCGHVYCGNLPEALEDTPWQYCPIASFYGHFKEGMEMQPFLSACISHPKIEHLVKTGFCMIVSSLVYRGDYSHILDETQGRTHRLLRVMAEDVPFLRNLDPDLSTLEVFQRYCRRNLKGRQELLLWQMENKINRDILEILKYMTPHRMMRYMESQYQFLSLRRNRYGTVRYSCLQDLVSEYRDYLDMCVKQDCDMRSNFVLYPKDLQKSHDKTAHRIKLKADAKVRREFKAAYNGITGRMDFEMEGMKIVYPAAPGDVIAEGNALHHCVGGYVERVAKRECVILFLRRCGEESKPFYTVEVRDWKVAQVRGRKNDPPTPEVQRFVEQWEREVLAVPAMQEAA